MRRRPQTSLLAAILALACMLAVPAVAQARRVIAPPGNSGVEQYVEVLPGAQGNVPVSAGGQGKALPKATRHRLEESGAEGRAAAQFAQSTGPEEAGQAGHHSSTGKGEHPRPGGAAGGKGGGKGGTGGTAGGNGSPPSSGGIARAVQSATQAGSASGGLGAGLPIALGAIALIAAAAFLLRRRLG